MSCLKILRFISKTKIILNLDWKMAGSFQQRCSAMVILHTIKQILNL
nr:MAG TPA: hypothetical protein [Caudoviricetes sp.]